MDLNTINNTLFLINLVKISSNLVCQVFKPRDTCPGNISYPQVIIV